ncbi:hypothetical protein [Rhizobium sullae]|uniref:PhyR sigma4 domain-containing protein n=1 Tax=Rhizobium sullae TaxID=50338 RepID=A0A4R3QE69_RHISU|nr:hypothetical protein [Rhizobium sullae]TCU17902.1 hypothetical protein EV132_10318 [Rhizobium sullae]
MTIQTQFEACVSRARALAAFPSGSRQVGDKIVSSALEALEGRVPEGSTGIFTVLFFREIAKAIIDKPLEISSDDEAEGRIKCRFLRLPPRERLAFWLVEFSRFSDEMAAQVLELDPEEFDSLLTPAYRKFFQGISLVLPPETSTPAVLH